MKKLFSLLTLALLTMSAWAVTAVNFDFTTGYENGQEVTSVYDEANGVTIAFGKGSATNVPKWYNTGKAIRVYGGGTITVSADQTIVAVEFTFGTGDNTNAITSNPAGYSEPKWTGAANNVVFTVGGSSGHRRIAGMTVTLDDSTPVVPKVEAPVFNPNGGTLTQESTAVTVSCATENASIQLYQVVDGELEYVNDFFPSNGVTEGTFYVTETSTYAAYAYKNGMDNSDTTYVTFTKNDYNVGGTATFVAGVDADPDVEYREEADQTISKDNVTMVFHGTHYNYYNVGAEGDTTWTYTYRIYKGKEIKFTSAAGNIRKIEFNCESSNPITGFDAVEGLDMTTGVWEGNARTITFTANQKQVRCYSITVTLDDQAPAIVVADPVFNPENNTKFAGSEQVTITCQTQGANIYYSINDGDYLLYEGPYITLYETSTVKAYAELQGVQSNIVSAKYTKLVEVSTIAQANELAHKTDFIFYGGVVVVYQNGSNLWVKDDTGYGLIYGNQVPQVEVGATLAEEWDAQHYLFRDKIHEYQYPNNVQATDDALVEIVPNEYAEAAIDTTKINERVLVKGLTLTPYEEDPKYLYTADGMAIYNQFEIEYPTDLEGKTFDVEGMVSYYNNAVQIMPIAITEVQAAGLIGDVNNDNVVNITDVTILISAVMAENFDNINFANADLSGDNIINITDVTMLINKVMAQ